MGFRPLPPQWRQDISRSHADRRQPIGLTPRMLKRIGMLPRSWPEQRRSLGFPD